MHTFVFTDQVGHLVRCGNHDPDFDAQAPALVQKHARIVLIAADDRRAPFEHHKLHDADSRGAGVFLWYP